MTSSAACDGECCLRLRVLPVMARPTRDASDYGVYLMPQAARTLQGLLAREAILDPLIHLPRCHRTSYLDIIEASSTNPLQPIADCNASNRPIAG